MSRVLTVLLTFASACAGNISDTGVESEGDVGVNGSGLHESETLVWTDGAATLTVPVLVEHEACDGTQPEFNIHGTVQVTQRRRISALVSIDGGPQTELPIINSTAEFPSTPPFVASYSVDVPVPAGVHEVMLCFAVRLTLGVSTIQQCMSHVIDTDITCAAPPGDTTPPTIDASFDPGANASGWNNTDVTVSWNCDDPESGIVSCSADETLTLEGANQSASGTAVNGDGLSTTITVGSISIDKTAPNVSVAISPGANANGWTNSFVTVTYSCDDALSGVVSCPESFVFFDEGAGQSTSGVATDVAGNSATGGVSDINIDFTAPTVSASRSVAPNADGWNNTPVTFSFECADALSGIQFCSDPMVLDSEGTDQYGFGETLDLADNYSSVSEGPVNIDLTAPTVSIVGARAYQLHEFVDVHCEASDDLSGVKSSSCNEALGFAYVLGGGSHTVSGSATDYADNTGSASASYSVEVTAVGLCALATSFADKPGQAKAACALIKSIQDSVNKGHIMVARIKLLVFSLLVSLRFNGFTAQEGQILSNLAGELVP